MKKIYFLGTCSTCIRIIKDLDAALDGFEKIDIKLQSLTFDEIDQMCDLAGSYGAFFSKRAMKYKALKDQTLQSYLICLNQNLISKLYLLSVMEKFLNFLLLL